MKHILLLCGGDSNERDVSLSSGRAVAEAILAKGYTLTIADVDKDLHASFYHSYADLEVQKPFLTESFLPALMRSDYHVAYIALHGVGGEDGHIQSILDIAGLPYTGSSMMASSAGFDKVFAHEVASYLNITSPQFFTITKKDFFTDIHRKLSRVGNVSYPCIIKPACSGSSVGVSLVFNRGECQKAIQEVWRHDHIAIIQNYIPGRELSCGVLGNSSTTECEALPVAEIIPQDNAKFFDYEQKYSTEHGAREKCPAKISKKLKVEVQKSAIAIHRALHCDGLSRSDFIYHEETETLYFLEINTIPGMTPTSLCPQEARAAGISFEGLVYRQIALATQKRL